MSTKHQATLPLPVYATTVVYLLSPPTQDFPGLVHRCNPSSIHCPPTPRHLTLHILCPPTTESYYTSRPSHHHNNLSIPLVFPQYDAITLAPFHSIDTPISGSPSLHDTPSIPLDLDTSHISHPPIPLSLSPTPNMRSTLTSVRIPSRRERDDKAEADRVAERKTALDDLVAMKQFPRQRRPLILGVEACPLEGEETSGEMTCQAIITVNGLVGPPTGS
jgi:hypothetical protein